MIILDTSIWIEFYRGNAPFFEAVSSSFRNRNILGLPWVFGELLQGAKGKSEIDVIHETWQALPKISLTLSEKAWLDAGRLSSQQKWLTKGVGLIDAAIICAAIETRSKVWTLDKNLASILKSKNMLFS